MIIGLIALAAAAAPSPSRQLAPPRVECTSPEHHQFDFWVGEWNVEPHSPGSGPHGHSSISKAVNGCAIQEHFSTVPNAQGKFYEGVSFAAYDTFQRRWNNYYIDSSGHPLWFQGGSDGKGMILWSLEEAPAGSYTRRMEVVPQDDGTVRQSGFVTFDNGRTWQSIYDLIYRRTAK